LNLQKIYLKHMKKLLYLLMAGALLVLARSDKRRMLRGNDKWGSGFFGASRGNRPHLGVDVKTTPGERIYAPADMWIERTSNPYSTGSYSGLKFRMSSNSRTFVGRVFYVLPNSEVVGLEVKQGQFIGTAQDISKKYPGMINHAHWQLKQTEGIITPNGITYNGDEYVNPMNFLNFT
jgi:hypothetical protein